MTMMTKFIAARAQISASVVIEWRSMVQKSKSK
jgi:hypothetical protein